jgi:MYXO-CTERM domain-containing protein
MQNDYQGPPEDFALVIPVPVVLKEADVKILRDELFDRVDKLASPRLVEYWEQDPCDAEGTIGLGNTGLIGRGGGGGTGSGYGRGGGGTVVIEAQFQVGEYEIVILSATESTGLDDWLHDNGYNIPAGAEPLLRPYVEQGMKFFVAKVNPKKVKFAANGRAQLSPLRFHYDSKDFVLPVRLGLINAPDPSTGGKQDLLIHILAPATRYQVANYPNTTIPTNLDLEETAKDHFGEFYVSLFDHTLEQHRGAVVTEYAWGAGSCDPCPGPDAALTNQELLELGGDVMSNWSSSLSVGSSGGGSVPTVRQSAATVTGPLDKDIIRRIVRAHINEVRYCYNTGLVKNPSLAGNVTVNFVIDGQGKVASSTVASTTLADTNVGACVANAVKRWMFPKPPGGALVTVSYPFDLAPGSGSGSGFGRGMGFGGSMSKASSFVLTRLHARYDATSLGEDLVFEAAPALTGGRETFGQPERGATINEGGVNNFQARYAIRHEWTGKIACADPIRERWGGPPAGQSNEPMLARQLTDVARGGSLGSFITASAGEQINVALAPAVEPTPAEPTPAEPPGPPAEPTPAATPPGQPATATPAAGCGCTSTPQPALPAAPLALFALLGLRLRQRCRARQTAI